MLSMLTSHDNERALSSPALVHHHLREEELVHELAARESKPSPLGEADTCYRWQHVRAKAEHKLALIVSSACGLAHVLSRPDVKTRSTPAQMTRMSHSGHTRRTSKLIHVYKPSPSSKSRASEQSRAMSKARWKVTVIYTVAGAGE